MKNRTHFVIQQASAILMGSLAVLALFHPSLWLLFLIFLLPLGAIQLIGAFYFGFFKGNLYMKWHVVLSVFILAQFLFFETFSTSNTFWALIGGSIILAISYWVQTFKGIKYIRPHDVLDLE